MLDSIVPGGSPESTPSPAPDLPNVPASLEERGVSDETNVPKKHIEAKTPVEPTPDPPENEDKILEVQMNLWRKEAQDREDRDGQGSPRSSISASMFVRQKTSEFAQKSWKGTWWFIRWVFLREIAFRQIPMAYVVTIPALITEFILSVLLKPSQTHTTAGFPGTSLTTETPIFLYSSWIPFMRRDELHWNSYGHFEWYPIYEVIAKGLMLALPTWVTARLFLGRKQFWQQRWRCEVLAFVFFIVVLAGINWCGAIVGHWNIDTNCVPVSYPVLPPLAALPCIVVFIFKMKRLTGTHHYTALVLLALLQGSLFTVEYVLFVRHAWMWPDTDLAIFIYKCTFHPLLWTFVLHPVLRHTTRTFDLPMEQKACLWIIYVTMPYASGRLLLFSFKASGVFVISAIFDQLMSIFVHVAVPQIDQVFFWVFRCGKFPISEEQQEEIDMLGMIGFQVMVSVEAGTAMLFAVTPVVLYPERLIFQRFFTACSATETIELKTFAGKFGLSFGLMLMEDIGLSILWLKDDLPLIQAFDLMFSSCGNWFVLAWSYLAFLGALMPPAALLPEFMECQDPMDICSCARAPMFAELCGCCGSDGFTSNKTVCLSLVS